MNALGENQTIAAFANIRNSVFAEYFDNRLYLIELYLDCVMQTCQRECLSVDEFSATLVKEYLRLISEEEAYFKAQFEHDFSKF